jgi:hypothetical protein
MVSQVQFRFVILKKTCLGILHPSDKFVETGFSGSGHFYHNPLEPMVGRSRMRGRKQKNR